MNVILPRPAATPPMTYAEFLAWVEPLEARYEFAGGRPVPMVGNTFRHSRLQLRLGSRLLDLLQGTPFTAITGETFARVMGRLRLPDVYVVPVATDPAARVIDGAVVVFEILSESTAHTGRFEKSAEYFATPSILHYVMLEQDRAAAVVLSRGADTWIRLVATDDGAIELPAIGLSLPLAQLYAGLLPTGSTAGEVGSDPV